MKHLKAIDYLRIELEREKQIVKDNPEVKESADYHIKVLEEMIFELENLQVNHNSYLLLKVLDKKMNTIKTRLEYFYVGLVSSVLGVITGLIII